MRLTVFGKYLIKWYVPRVWRNFLDFLTVERNAEQLWAQPSLPVFQKGKCAVEITTAHADAMTVHVEGDNRRNDKITQARGNTLARNWLPYAEKILVKSRIRSEFAKNHFAVQGHYWRENALFCAPRARDDRCRINFVTVG